MELLTEKNAYDDFLKTRFVSGNFLQSSVWQSFLDVQAKNWWQLAVIDNNQTVASCLFYENKLPLSRSYFYAPKGPIFLEGIVDQKKQEALKLMLSKIRDITIDTKQAQEIFFTLEPNDAMSVLPELIPTSNIQPMDTWVLDLESDLPSLLGGMHAKTRYNIALAKRKGVQIRFSSISEDIDYFLELIKQTASRNQITVHSENYYKLLWQTLIKEQAGQLALAEVEGKVVAVNILLRFGSAVTYLHGASDYSFRKYMAPHLLQWECIKQSKELGYSIYDFWGINPADGSKPNWQGFTRFKKNFGGRAINSPAAYDLIYDQGWYKLYQLSNKFKSILKR